MVSKPPKQSEVEDPQPEPLLAEVVPRTVLLVVSVKVNEPVPTGAPLRKPVMTVAPNCRLPAMIELVLDETVTVGVAFETVNKTGLALLAL
jgi:hypothetical protein